MKNKVIYPCIITKDDNIYYANFVDFNACFTDGETMEEILTNTKEVLNGVIYSMIKNKIELPKPTIDLTPNENEKIMYVECWLAPIYDKINNQAVKKTLTIPKWLNDEAIKNNVNFSNLLQTAIKDYLGIR